MLLKTFAKKLSSAKNQTGRKAFKTVVDTLTTAANETYKGDGHSLAGIHSQGALVNLTPKMAMSFATDVNFDLTQEVHNYVDDVLDMYKGRL